MTHAQGNAFQQLVAKYTSLLEAYVSVPNEELRERAHLLSSEAIASGYGVLDVTAAHREAFLRIVERSQSSQESKKIAQRASEFLLESLAPFEMTHRGYQETIKRLSTANEELRKADEALKIAHDELEGRVKERTTDLTRVNAELQASNKELESFAYSVSHDLRAPLRHIDGFAKVLMEDYTDKLDEQGKEYLEFLRAAAQRMGQLIDGMLALSRVTRATMYQQRVDLSETVQSIATELKSSQPEREADFIMAPGLMVIGDERLLRILLENLLRNAWKFTSKCPKARIEFGMVEQDGKKVYYVRDNGAGFDMAYASKLFGAFQRLHSEQEFPGIGIGLATVQRIVRRYGGQVWAEGKPDQGATFYFTLD